MSWYLANPFDLIDPDGKAVSLWFRSYIAGLLKLEDTQVEISFPLIKLIYDFITNKLSLWTILPHKKWNF